MNPTYYKIPENNSYIVGDKVVVTPTENDNFIHEFTATIALFNGHYIVVKDVDGDYYTVTFEQVKVLS